VVARGARVFVIAGIALFAPGGSLASASLIEGDLAAGYRYVADPGESNQLTVRSTKRTWVFTDPGATIRMSPTAPCTQRSPTEVTCAAVERDEPETAFGASLGDGDDTVDVNVPRRLGVSGGSGNDRITVEGGDHNRVSGDGGDDTITGGSGQDDLAGDAGADRIRAVAGFETDQLGGGSGTDRLIGSNVSDSLRGGRDDDVLRGRKGSDMLEGGPGRDDIGGGSGRADTVVYRPRRTSVTLDGRANDGVHRERDLVHRNVENVSIRHGRAAGNERPNSLSVGIGTLIGKGGADTLHSLQHARMYGGTGRDHLSGLGSMFGGPGDDMLLEFGPAPRHLSGGPGNDTIESRSGPCTKGRVCARDWIECGSGNDLVTADRRDIVASDCERISRASATTTR